MRTAALAVAITSSAFLFVYGVNLVHLAVRALRLRPVVAPAVPAGAESHVCVQVPIYDERYVAGRVIAAACALDWPADRLEVQVLDDSDDDTAAVAARAVERARRQGIRAEHVRRGSRDGYKAGALAHGMALTTAPVLAVLDADFVPPRDFLRRTVGALADPDVAFVQARWGHLNERFSAFTRVQALMVDFHFLVEQAVRPAAGWPTNFTGTAGVWRRAAIEDAGGWSARTLTEDLDLSYRVQLRGWRGVFLEDVVVPQELPVSVAGYRGQQLRWATGSFQVAFHVLPRLLASRLRPAAKFEGAMHLLGYAAPLLMLLQIACYPFLLAGSPASGLPEAARVPLAANLVSVAPLVGLAVAQARRGPRWWRRLPAIAGWSFIGAGTSLAVSVALLRAFRSRTFNRTPKYRIERAGQEWREGAYVQVVDAFVPAELALAAAMAALAFAAAAAHHWLLFAYAVLFGAGFGWLGGLGALQALEVLTLRRLGRGALQADKGDARAGAVVVPGVALLGAFAGLGVGFEDSYQHWLAAATLATTGRLHDPLFGMEDSWLPAYQVVAAGVLWVAGTWNLAALRALSMALSAGVLLLVHALAGNPRRGRIAVVLLALNPAFLLTGTEVVAEPLLVVLVLGAMLCVTRDQRRAAAVLAAAACLVGTKAWLWLGVAVGVQALLLLRRGHGRPRLQWAVPAVAVLALLQLAFAPATHSASRAALEAASAGARGSVLTDPLLRGAAFAGWFALASLPLVLLAPLGLARELRERPAVARVLHLPSLGYLAAVTALVAAGVYSGSHRYYEPALPALALLAAAGLESIPLAAVAATAGAAAIAIVYAPIAAAFTAENAGLLAAGRAAAQVPGAFVTDSPAAAYASRKPPAQIVGSAALPGGHDQALSFLRQRGVGPLVLERVDYYRGAAVFPSLVSGRGEPPFVALGDESSYSVAAGKPVTAWFLPPAIYHAGVAGVAWLCADPADEPRAGKSASLEKGPVLELGDQSIAGEGIGFGVPIARFADGWVFAGDATTTDLSAAGGVAWRKTYRLDRAERATADGRFAGFAPIPARGEVTVDYRVTADGLHVSALVAAPGAQQVVLLNEESSRFDDEADAEGTRVGRAFGPVVPVAGGWARLRAAGLGLEWAVVATAGQLEAGRELDAARGLDWAGIELRLPPGATAASYDVTFRRAR